MPWWKKLLSYLFEFHIESAPSDINPHLYVSLRKGRYQLSTANAVYSYEDLYDNYTKTFQKMDLDKLDIKNVLILGFGLGSIPFMLEKVFKRNYHYTAVEIDENVFYLAQKYALPELGSSIEMITADAYAYVMQCQEQYDLIAMDIFLDDVVPTQFESLEYLEALKTLLAKDGILLYNRLALSTKDLEGSKSFFDNNFKTVFPNGQYWDVDGNWMLMNRGL